MVELISQKQKTQLLSGIVAIIGIIITIIDTFIIMEPTNIRLIDQTLLLIYQSISLTIFSILLISIFINIDSDESIKKILTIVSIFYTIHFLLSFIIYLVYPSAHSWFYDFPQSYESLALLLQTIIMIIALFVSKYEGSVFLIWFFIMIIELFSLGINDFVVVPFYRLKHFAFIVILPIVLVGLLTEK